MNANFIQPETSFTIQDFSPEILQMIAKRMDCQSMLRFSSICKVVYQALSDPLLKKHHLEQGDEPLSKKNKLIDRMGISLNVNKLNLTKIHQNLKLSKVNTLLVKNFIRSCGANNFIPPAFLKKTKYVGEDKINSLSRQLAYLIKIQEMLENSEQTNTPEYLEKSQKICDLEFQIEHEKKLLADYHQELNNLNQNELTLTTYFDLYQKLCSLFPNLNKFNLSFSPITDRHLSSLYKLTNLSKLKLRNCNMITSDGIASLQKSLPNCQIITK